jgi:hypothetical protein
MNFLFAATLSIFSFPFVHAATNVPAEPVESSITQEKTDAQRAQARDVAIPVSDGLWITDSKGCVWLIAPADTGLKAVRQHGFDGKPVCGQDPQAMK